MISLRSKITQSVLNYFMLQQGAEIYVSDFARITQLESGNLTRKLADLEKDGILKSRWQGNQRYYSLNKNFPLLKEYRSIVLKTVGFEQILRNALSKISGIKKAIIFGSYAQDKMDSYSDIDLLIVGEHSTITLQRGIADVQKTIHREINAVSMSLQEYAAKKRNDPFLMSIESKKSIKIL
ncbi:MAG: nucleotidyltransferase domain-containing protein [Candidatus Omnitrophica bacterium]|nr:nucleotidyltransferase domain-containing protein [Candidatus Omnitrophota bacterium]